MRDRAWLAAQWEAARQLARDSGKWGAVLALDEIQKIPDWSQTVKSLWDQDTTAKLPLRAVLLGSAPLLMQRGLSESLAGRFETLSVPHWGFPEMKAAFSFSLDEYIHFGAYPGAAPLIGDAERWARYVKDSLIETTVSRDVLLLTRVDKPALLRQLFELACSYSGQVLSYTKMLVQLHDAGNTTTLAHYLDLLAGAWMVTGLSKYVGSAVRQRASSPKLQVLNTALISAQALRPLAETKADGATWGRLTESAIGAHLANAAAGGECDVYYWRERNREVDFVVQRGKQLLAIEVKSGKKREALPGLAAFLKTEPHARPLLMGGDGIPIEQALSRPVTDWFTA